MFFKNKYGDCGPVLLKNIYKAFNIKCHFLYSEFGKHGFSLDKGGGTHLLENMLNEMGVVLKIVETKKDNLINKVDSILLSGKMVAIITANAGWFGKNHCYFITNIEKGKKQINAWPLPGKLTENEIEAYRCINRISNRNRIEPVAMRRESNIFIEFNPDFIHPVEQFITKHTLLYDLGLTDKSTIYKHSVNYIIKIEKIILKKEFFQTKKFFYFPGLKKKLRTLAIPVPEYQRVIIDNSNSSGLTDLFIDNLKKNQSLLVKNTLGDFYSYSLKTQNIDEKAHIHIEHILEKKSEIFPFIMSIKIYKGVSINHVKSLINYFIKGGSFSIPKNPQYIFSFYVEFEIKNVKDRNPIQRLKGSERKDICLRFGEDVSETEIIKIFCYYLKFKHLSTDTLNSYKVQHSGNNVILIEKYERNHPDGINNYAILIPGMVTQCVITFQNRSGSCNRYQYLVEAEVNNDEIIAHLIDQFELTFSFDFILQTNLSYLVRTTFAEIDISAIHGD